MGVHVLQKYKYVIYMYKNQRELRFSNADSAKTRMKLLPAIVFQNEQLEINFSEKNTLTKNDFDTS